MSHRYRIIEMNDALPNNQSFGLFFFQNPSPKKRSSSASRKNKALANGNDSHDDYLLPTNSKSVSNPHLSPNPATQMDVDEENNDGEGEQPNDNDGNPGTNASNASLRRGGRQRKKVIFHCHQF